MSLDVLKVMSHLCGDLYCLSCVGRVSGEE